MSVSTTLTLPAHPTAGGTSKYLPLGGNGFIAPHSMYVVDGLEVAGDVSGGTAAINVNFDERYTSVLLFAGATIVAPSPATDQDTRLSMLSLDPTGAVIFSTAINIAAKYIVFDDTARCNWSPDPIFQINQCSMRNANVNTVTYRLDLIMYNFNLRVAEVIPMSQILASLPRSGQAIGA